jgi:hypothetical protein
MIMLIPVLPAVAIVAHCVISVATAWTLGFIAKRWVLVAMPSIVDPVGAGG